MQYLKFNNLNIYNLISIMKNIKIYYILTALFSAALLSSCSFDPIDKTYNKHTADDDYRRIREISDLDSADEILLGRYMIDHQLVGSHVMELHTTYSDILATAKKEQKIYEIEKRNRSNNKKDLAQFHENEKIKNLKKVLDVDFVKPDTLLENEDLLISPKKIKKPLPPVNKNIITYEVMFKNISDKGIKAFKGDINFYDSFHSEIKKVTFTNYNEIPVNGFIVQKFTINLDEVSKGNALYNNLNKDCIKVDWVPDRLIHSDDSVIE